MKRKRATSHSTQMQALNLMKSGELAGELPAPVQNTRGPGRVAAEKLAAERTSSKIVVEPKSTATVRLVFSVDVPPAKQPNIGSTNSSLESFRSL